MKKEKIDALKEMGNVWEKHGKRRVYIDDLPDLIGLELSRYNTGNISSARFRKGSVGASEYGEGRISNSQAGRILSALPDKLWYDLDADDFGWKGGTAEAVEVAIEAVEKKISTL